MSSFVNDISTDFERQNRNDMNSGGRYSGDSNRAPLELVKEHILDTQRA